MSSFSLLNLKEYFAQINSGDSVYVFDVRAKNKFNEHDATSYHANPVFIDIL